MHKIVFLLFFVSFSLGQNSVVRQFSKVNIQSFENNDKLKHLNDWLKFYTNHKLFKQLMVKHPFWIPSSQEVIYP